MITRLILVCASLLAVAHVARADDLAPGLWELSLEAKVEADPGFQTGPLTVNQCVTKNETSDMSKVLAPITTAGASNCSFSEKSYVGDTFRFTMQCAGTLQLKTTGEVTFSATAMHGTITTSSTIDGKSVEFTSAISGHRLGDC